MKSANGAKNISTTAKSELNQAVKKFKDHHVESANKGIAKGEASKRTTLTTSLFSMRLFNADRDLPIVYCDNYNISMIGFELMHNFDTKKYGKIAEILSHDFLDTPYAYHVHHRSQPENSTKNRRLNYLYPNRPVFNQELLIHHTEDYIKEVHENKSLIARITESWLLNLVPMFLLESRLLTPLKWQVAGTIFATHLAMQHGWAINLGGGFHQGSNNEGDTFCLFSDILLTMKYIWRKHPLQKFMIIDLDAHQATGVERDLMKLDSRQRRKVFILDVFNKAIQPQDEFADRSVDIRVELDKFTGDKTYLKLLAAHLTEAFDKFKPTIVIYVAGQDVLLDDQLGLLNLSDEALMKRDELVFTYATEKYRCPIVMLLGGGYLARGIKVQADSIRNLYAKGLIWGGHRSGSRSLSRPLKKKSKSSLAQSISNQLHKSDSVRKSAKTEVVNAIAPVLQTVISKKLPKDSSQSKKKT